MNTTTNDPPNPLALILGLAIAAYGFAHLFHEITR